MKKSNWEGKNGPLLIAEIGGNHEGNFSYAKKLTKLAIKSDVDVIKFQIYTGDTLVNRLSSPSRNKHFKKFQLTQDQHIYLAKMCNDNGVKYLASVWNVEALKWIDRYLDFYKIGSGDLTCYQIIQEFAKRGKPIILSSGLSTIKEINETIKFLIERNRKYKSSNNLSVLQCTSTYPTQDQDANLRVIKSLKKNKNITAGYSDHTIGSLALLTAYSLGAQVLEFHFTDTRKNKIFRDHKVSLDMIETKELIQNIKRIKKMLGKNIKKPTKEEIKSNHTISFRRAIFLKKDYLKGQIIKENDLISLRPNIGIDARDFKKVIGKKTKRDIKMLEKLKFNKNV
ncbi:N-acetylneuraminate synthase family protein [Pelagibacteraceae bacterium]|jgi:N,N'-diacetyllegionaminate synthase|nr:N-acetylneuraminate synthase family protein [Pelagibacteraceae bacterium]MDC0952873.1 N-acetylneuraminate synthase family protein [Pelagibacteraceae bacterium]